MDEVLCKDIAGGIAEVENIGSPIDREHDGENGQYGQCHFVDEVIEPCFGDRPCSEATASGPVLDQSLNAGDGENAGQLHHPPDEQLHAEECIAHP